MLRFVMSSPGKKYRKRIKYDIFFNCIDDIAYYGHQQNIIIPNIIWRRQCNRTPNKIT